MDPDPNFSAKDPDFWPIRIRTQEKRSIRNPDIIETLISVLLKGLFVCMHLSFTNHLFPHNFWLAQYQISITPYSDVFVPGPRNLIFLL